MPQLLLVINQEGPAFWSLLKRFKKKEKHHSLYFPNSPAIWMQDFSDKDWLIYLRLRLCPVRLCYIHPHAFCRVVHPRLP